MSLFCDVIVQASAFLPVKHFLINAHPACTQLTWIDYPKYRLWRKNVSPLGGTSCVGVDLNRNFDFHWSKVLSLSCWVSLLFLFASLRFEICFDQLTIHNICTGTPLCCFEVAYICVTMVSTACGSCKHFSYS